MSSNFNTGDIILCHSQSDTKPDPGIDGLIEIFTHSPYEHTGFIIVDPYWVEQKGVYILQSGWGPNEYPDVINGNTSGVTLNKLCDFMKGRNYVCYRRLSGQIWNRDSMEKLKEIFDTVHGKPYDSNPIHWICMGISYYAYLPNCANSCVKKNTNRFTCSALVVYIMVMMEWIDDIDWSDKAPTFVAKLKLQSPLCLGIIKRFK